MLDDRIIRAARNNAQWCDAVCRAHGNPGEFHDDIWLNRHRVPRFYPNAGTLAEPSPHQLALIDELIGTRLPSGWAVKDSFSMLDLSSRGFEVLFAAHWIYLAVSRVRKDATAGKTMRWKVVQSDHELAEWESAFSRSSGDTGGDRIFLPSLLQNKDIGVLAGSRDDRIVAGAVANRSDDVVGWSNFFAPSSELRDCAVDLLSAIAGLFPDLPIVGYEHGDDLRHANALGFESLGPLRVWTLQS
jgi:hypothetical protein